MRTTTRKSDRKISSASPSDTGTSDITTPTHADAFLVLCCALWFAALLFSLARLAPPLPDFGSLETQARKSAFFEYLRPIVRKVNDRTRDDKAYVDKLMAQLESGNEPSWFERSRIASLAEKYEVETADLEYAEVLATLERRIGVIPEPLVLIQAAKESGWGTSRFAVEGNNLFGQRCYERGCGIAPLGRAENTRFGVARFDTVEASIESYTRNLNTHPKYQGFRELRQQLRKLDRPLKALDLAQGLLGYSERGQVYVEEIKSMIRQNDLE
jgi:Bax protein